MCAENLLFYEAVEQWKKQDIIEEKKKLASHIFHNFVAETACQQVNVSSIARKRLAFEVSQETIPSNLFDLAVREISVLLQLEMFPKFLSLYHQQEQAHTTKSCNGRNSFNV